MLLSKTKYMAGAQCLKRLYLSVHSPELGAQPDESDQAITEQGHEVGLLAQQMFPGGVAVDCETRGEAIRATRELVANPAVPSIFEAAFAHGDVFVRVDILHRRRDGRWRLIEVKSTTVAKDHHLQDVAVQHRVVSRSGVDLAASCLAHVNREYVHDGGQIDARSFFKIRNFTNQVKRVQHEVATQLRSEFRVLEMPTPPRIEVGRQCTDPVICEFFQLCNPQLPEDHLLRLPRIHANTIAKLVELGVQSIHDIPQSYPLSERLRRACSSVQTNTPWFGPALGDGLRRLKYPLYFADFETIYPGIPRFVGMRPYDHIPFQYSVHLVRQPGAALEHFEFLATDQNDPRPAFISMLCDALGDRGSIVVYNQQFESQRLSELALWLPEFSGRINKIQRRLWDLLLVIRDCVYHPKFCGSYSLKSVLPALVPEMSYDDMEVADGQSAGLAWESLIHGEWNKAEHHRKRQALLDYCAQDTLGMIRVLEVLKRNVQS